jgi:ribosomal protein S18 acetylase RimI-like enzyme
MAGRLLDMPACLSGVHNVYALNYSLKSAIDESEPIGTLHELHRLSRVDVHAVLEQLTHLEKKAFPAYEVFLFDMKLVKQPNATVMFLTDDTPGTLTRLRPVQGYIVGVSFQGKMLLHKICVAECWRRRGIGKYLIDQIILRAQSMSSRSVELWVCESRIAARSLYTHCGFMEAQRMQDYYSIGRHAIKMVLNLES